MNGTQIPGSKTEGMLIRGRQEYTGTQIFDDRIQVRCDYVKILLFDSVLSVFALHPTTHEN